MKWNSGQAAIVYYRQTKMKKAEYNLALMVVCMLSGGYFLAVDQVKSRAARALWFLCDSLWL